MKTGFSTANRASNAKSAEGIYFCNVSSERSEVRHEEIDTGWALGRRQLCPIGTFNRRAPLATGTYWQQAFLGNSCLSVIAVFRDCFNPSLIGLAGKGQLCSLC